VQLPCAVRAPIRRDSRQRRITDGSGLYLAVRNGSKARSWSFRHRGKRRTIGSAFRISLKNAQAQVHQFRDQIDNDEDPFAVSSEEEKGETFREAVAAHYEHKCQSEWGKTAQSLGRSMIKTYIENAPCADKLLKDIGVKELKDMFKPTWTTKPVIARRTVLMLKEMFDIAITDDPPRHPGPNPALITKTSRLRRQLGKQPIGGHRLGLAVESVPKLMAHLRTPLFAHGPDECTTAEAAEAIGCDTEAILRAIKLGRLPGAYRLPGRDWTNASWIVPIAELKTIFRFRQPLRRHAEIPLAASVLQFIMFTAVRAEMACGLRWDEVKEKKGYIDFDKRHKMAERDPEAEYTIPLTDTLVELLDRMRAEQRHDRIESDWVFVHGATRVGLNRWLGQPVRPTTINDFLKTQLVRLDLVNGETDWKKMPSTHGFRSTFPEWACELNNYPRDFIDAQLGHKQPGNNWMYFRKVTYINPRRDIMKDWEKYCLSWSGEPTDNVVPLLPQPIEGKSRWRMKLRARK
jgi:integrase